MSIHRLALISAVRRGFGIGLLSLILGDLGWVAYWLDAIKRPSQVGYNSWWLSLSRLRFGGADRRHPEPVGPREGLAL